MDQKELLEIIDDAAKKNLTTLYLSESRLTQLPPALHKIKQYISNKYQDHISQVYDQKTQDEK